MSIKKALSLLSIVPLSYLFCLRTLPWRQSIRMPILIHPKSVISFVWKNIILKPKGRYIIDSSTVTPGMIRLGENLVSIYPSKGITIDNNNIIVFKGRCVIGNGSFISVHPTGTLQFGSNFYATTTLRIVCAQNIDFESDCLIGWDNLFTDTDLHVIKQYSTKERIGTGCKPIKIGKNNWFCMKNVVLKGTKTQDCTIVANNSVLRSDYSQFDKYCLIGGIDKIRVLKSDVYLDRNDNQIDWSLIV